MEETAPHLTHHLLFLPYSPPVIFLTLLCSFSHTFTHISTHTYLHIHIQSHTYTYNHTRTFFLALPQDQTNWVSPVWAHSMYMFPWGQCDYSSTLFLGLSRVWRHVPLQTQLGPWNGSLLRGTFRDQRANVPLNSRRSWRSLSPVCRC